jgi:hypothetical protein
MISNNEDEADEAELMSIPNAIDTALDEIFKALPRDLECISRIEHYLHSSTSGTKGMFGMLVRHQAVVTGTQMRIPEDSVMLDMPIFMAYMQLARARRIRYSSPGGGHRTADLMQDALELFALHENRPFHYVYNITQLLKMGPSRPRKG